MHIMLNNILYFRSVTLRRRYVAGPKSMVWSDAEYFRTYPSVRSYIGDFQGFDAFQDLSSARLFLSQHNQSHQHQPPPEMHVST